MASPFFIRSVRKPRHGANIHPMARQSMDNAALTSILKARFGYDSFRDRQEEVITNVLAHRDSLVLMPTGGGKSLCYQLPALVFDGVTLVVSPLIALMKDQVDALHANGIAARFINSTLSSSEMEQALAEVRRGQVKLLYVAPERLTLPGFRRFLHNLDLSLIAIDEAHCISEWGHEFRPDYRNLRQLREDFPSVPVIALTATATEQVREDIIAQLDLQRGQVFLSSFNRANLSYSVQPKNTSWEQLTAMLRRLQGQSSIIYCFSRQETEDLAEDLNRQGLAAKPYHAGLDAETRRRTQEDFVRDRVSIIVATVAFGMGVDKPDIRLVVHYSLPKSLESYYQETGRAGRDGLPSECVLFYAYADKAKQDYFINQIEDPSERSNARQKLAKMVEFAELATCRRRFILEYFGESWEEENCGACDKCLRSEEPFDATEIAQKVLSAVIRTGERFGANHVIQVLVGSRTKRVLELGHDQLSVYGLAKDFAQPQLRDIIGQLQARGLLSRSEGEYPTLAVTPEGKEFLSRRETLSLPRPIAAPGTAEGTPSRAKRSTAMECDEGLFEELRALRRRLAEARAVAAFVVFNDASLHHMASAFPRNAEEFSRIPGVGKTKLEQYGPEFLEAICSYAEAHGIPHGTDSMPPGPGQREEAEEKDREPGERRRGTTYDVTKELLSEKLPISLIAQQRGLAETTVIGHIERMADTGIVLDIEHLLPDVEKLNRITEAFEVCGSAFLKPVWDFLGSEFDYNELRLARIYLRQEGRLADQ